MKEPPVAGADFGDDLTAIQGRITSMERNAAAVGIKRRLSKKGKLIGFGDGLPSATRLAEIFGEGPRYRLLSAVTHSAMWATIPLSYKRVDRSPNALTQNLRPVIALSLIQDSMEWFARIAWDYFTLNGWGLKRLSSIFESEFDKLDFAEDNRFWKGTA